MISDIKKNLSKHEMILEKYKNKLFCDKQFNQNENLRGKDNPFNEINSKTLKIKDNINSQLTLNKPNDSSPPMNNLSKTEKKIGEILNKANYTLFENPKKSENINQNKNLSSADQVKKIIQENTINKINQANNNEKVRKIFLVFMYKIFRID